MNTAPTNPAARPAASHPAPAEAEVHGVDRQTLQAWMEHPDQLTVIARSSGEFGTVAHPRLLRRAAAARRERRQLADRIGHRAVLIDQSGPRGIDAQRRLAAVGVTDLHILEGGSPGGRPRQRPVVGDHLWNSTSVRPQASWSPPPRGDSLASGPWPGCPSALPTTESADPSSPPDPLEALPRREVRSR